MQDRGGRGRDGHVRTTGRSRARRAERLATVEAGALLGDVYDRLDADGLTIAAGACPSVGIAGLTLGGGLGILGRRYGLTSDQLLGAQVVLADGRIVDCDEQHEPDLFWALRGAGGGQFGIVTSLLFRTVPAEDLTCFSLAWPYAQAAAAIALWQDWAPDAPDELAASLLVNAAGEPDEPVVTIFGAMLGTKADTTEILRHVVERLEVDPVSTTIEQMPHRAAKLFLAEHAPGVERSDDTTPVAPPRPSLMFARSEFFRRSLPPDAIASLVDSFAAGRGPRHACELDFTPCRSWSIVHPYGSGGVYPSFPDPDLTNWERAYHDVNYERLTEVKARYDRDDLFRFHQSLPPDHPKGRSHT